MAKYLVSGQMLINVTVMVEDEENQLERDGLINLANEKTSLTNYAGNGGVDKLIGTQDEDVSIEPASEVLLDEYEMSFDIDVQKIER